MFWISFQNHGEKYHSEWLILGVHSCRNCPWLGQRRCTCYIQWFACSGRFMDPYLGIWLPVTSQLPRVSGLHRICRGGKFLGILVWSLLLQHEIPSGSAFSHVWVINILQINLANGRTQLQAVSIYCILLLFHYLSAFPSVGQNRTYSTFINMLYSD